MKLKHITFTGIDEKTSVYAIKSIQKEWPIAEFGVLMSKNWSENGKRYPSPEIIDKFMNHGLNLSAHLCGSIAREAYSGNFEPAIKVYPMLNSGSFQRTQLNVANSGELDPGYLSYPIGIMEVIVQQNSPTIGGSKGFIRLLGKNNEHRGMTMLIDPSGGRGVDEGLDVIDTPHKTGYAGGINAENVEEKLRFLMELDTVGDFWIDMESGVRADDWFDIDKVVEVLKICTRVLEDYREESVGVKQSPSETFPRANDFIVGSSYRR